MAEERSVGILRRLPWLRSGFRLRTQMSSERLNFHSLLLPFDFAPGRSESVRMTGFGAESVKTKVSREFH